MTALQDWLTLKPVDHGIRDMVCRPFRAVLSTPATAVRRTGTDVAAPLEFTLQRPGLERC
ncbi:hypothetical protein [Mycolicibacterium sediminis]|uniref:Uncharacterized protein n=1 Tax=Mycolicibacterium sediminis TaxID=1286180 RepID=A0A7I7QUV8_9MYCO|nr:hypothetical protein [Mycolicibacterium sediminis]BBY29676.1 hypothetical protein MSEDJ_37720 [Mycolicibacterium sediminis]